MADRYMVELYLAWQKLKEEKIKSHKPDLPCTNPDLPTLLEGKKEQK